MSDLFSLVDRLQGYSKEQGDIYLTVFCIFRAHRFSCFSSLFDNNFVFCFVQRGE